MSFHELKLAILKYLQQNQKNEYVEVNSLYKILKKSSDDINAACLRLIEENLACEAPSVIANLQQSNIRKIKITKAGIDFLLDNESSETGKESNKINRKILYATIATVIVSIIAIAISMNLNIIFPKKIDLISVKITNETEETIQIGSSNNFWLWHPATMGVTYDEGIYEFVEADVIEILPSESIYVKAKILNTDRFYDYYKNEDCSITLWIRANRKLYDSNSLRFTKSQLKKYYIEFIINED